MPYIKIDPILGSGGGGGSGFANPATENLDMGPYNVVAAGGNNTWTVFETDGWAGVLAAVAAAEANGGGEVIIYPGTYVATSECAITDRVSDIRIRGFGRATIIQHDGSFSGFCFNMDPGAYLSAGKAVNNISAEDTTITFTTASDGGLIQADDFFTVVGTDAQGITDILVCEALAAGSGGTGVVTLKGLAQKSLTSCTIHNTIQSRNGFNNRITDMHFQLTDPTPTGPNTGAVHMGYQKSSSMERLSAEGFRDDGHDSTLAVFRQFDSIDFLMKECELDGAGANGILYSSSARCTIDNCVLENTSFNGAASSSAIRLTGAFDCSVINTKIVDARGNGVSFASGPCRRIQFSNVSISGCQAFGITTASCRELLIEDSVFVNNRKASGGFQAAIYLPNSGGSVDVSIDANLFENNEYDIYAEGCDDIAVTDNIHLNPANIPISITAASNACAVVGNICKGITGGNYGILLSAVNDGLVSSNLIDTANAYGIYLDNSDRNLVSGNQVVGATTDAIRLTATSDDNFVNSNLAFGQTITDLGTNNTLSNNKVA